MRKNKNNAYMKASVEMLEQAEDAIKSKYSQYDDTEDTMEFVLDEVKKGKDVLIKDAKKKGITEQDIKDAEYSKPNGLEVERYKRHLKRRGVTDEQVHDKKKYGLEEDNECGGVPFSLGKAEPVDLKYSCEKPYCNHWCKCENKRYEPNDELFEDEKSPEYDKWFKDETEQYDLKSDCLLNSENFNPILNNRFLCKLSFGDTVIEPYLVRSFHDDVFIKNIQLELFLDSEHIELEERLEEIYSFGRRGGLKFCILSPSGETIKNTEYSIKKIVSLCEPFYRYDDDGHVVYNLVLEYDIKLGNKESRDFEKTFNVNPIDLIEINRKIENNDYENSDLSERIRKINSKYQETSDSITPSEPSFEFGDFATALEYFEHHLVGDRQYVHNSKYDEVEKDIENNKRSTIVICSRQCGMTTHMLAHSLAKIATTPFYKIWYVTPYKQDINHILSTCVSNEVRNMKDFEFNRYDGTIKCKSRRSEIRFVSSSQRAETIFIGQTLPNEVIYDNMAFMKPEGLNEFINMLDQLEKVTGNYVKEICVSTPSEQGSIFNFLALIAEKPIEIPWFENPSRNNFLRLDMSKLTHYTNDWYESMEKILGKDNAEVELCCRLGVEDSNKFKNESLEKHFDFGCDDYLLEIPDDETEDKWYDYETTCSGDYYPDDYDYELF